MGGDPRARRRAALGRRRDDACADPRDRPSRSRSATRSGSPGPTTRPATASRRSSSSSATTGSRASSGWGRATRTAYYGETPGDDGRRSSRCCSAAIGEPGRLDEPRLGRRGRSPMDGRAIRGHGAAKCAIDIALHDLVGKVTGLPGPRAARPVAPTSRRPTSRSASTSRTIVAERAARAADFPALKIKCGGPADLATLEAVRAVFAGPIRVDANTGWTPRRRRARSCPSSIDLGVELIEQPFPARPARRARWLQERSSLPIVADESARPPRTSTASSGSSPAST